MRQGCCRSPDKHGYQNPSVDSSSLDSFLSGPYSLVRASNAEVHGGGNMGRTLAALTAAILACLIWTGVAGAQAPTAAAFQKVTLDDNTQTPMQLDVAPDG